LSHENALDKLTMIAQQLTAVTGVSAADAVTTHEAASDPHTGYAKLAGRSGGQTLNGSTVASENLSLHSTANATKGLIYIGTSYYDETTQTLYIDSGGITTTGPVSVSGAAKLAGGVIGSSSSGGTLTIASTSHGTKGTTTIGTSSDVTVDEVNHRVGIGVAAPTVTLDLGTGTGLVHTVYGASTSAGRLHLLSTSHATKGFVDLGTTSAYDETNSRLGVGTLTPSVALDVVGGANLTGALSSIRTVTVQGASYTVSAPTDCNSVIFDNYNGGIISLPDAATANKGCTITFFNSGTAGSYAINISPHSSDQIIGVCGAIAIDGAANKDLINTLGTHVLGDSVTLVSDGTQAWWIQSCTGVWAHET
jgi:hypothetical protein